MKEHESKIDLPQGFQAAGVRAGFKAHAPDLALIVSNPPATCAAAFTTNACAAAPVLRGREQLAAGRKAAAVLINSGNANACTGEDGLVKAQASAEMTARTIGGAVDEVWTCSTGHIGIPLPLSPFETGIPAATEELTTQAHIAAQAIMTTDTVPKIASAQLDGGSLVGICKGAGMIEPNMATMLGVVMTDLSIAPDVLQTALNQAVTQSFNRISVDGDQSTNDTVLLLANGASGRNVGTDFQSALDRVCLELAHQIVRDGEGVTKFITLRIGGAVNDSEADTAARVVANSLLVKTGWVGGAPVWGRILGAIGMAGSQQVTVDANRIAIDYGDVRAVENGLCTGRSAAHIAQLPEYDITIDLGLGDGTAILYTNDCTEEYVRINAEEYEEDEL